MEAKVVEIAEKCQNPESWHIMNVPERYIKIRQGGGGVVQGFAAEVAHAILYLCSLSFHLSAVDQEMQGCSSQIPATVDCCTAPFPPCHDLSTAVQAYFRRRLPQGVLHCYVPCPYPWGSLMDCFVMPSMFNWGGRGVPSMFNCHFTFADSCRRPISVNDSAALWASSL